jgi:hypothetical protein
MIYKKINKKYWIIYRFAIVFNLMIKKFILLLNN